MYGPHSGALALFLVDVDSNQRIHEARWYAYGDRGDKWLRGIYNLSLNIEKRCTFRKSSELLIIYIYL